MGLKTTRLSGTTLKYALLAFVLSSVAASSAAALSLKSQSAFDDVNITFLSHHLGGEKVDKLRFLHIPKTGTSLIITLRNFLDACQTKGYACRVGHSPGLVDGPDRTQVSRDDETCNGHLVKACGSSSEMHNSWVPEDSNLTVVAMLREPVARTISHYLYNAMSSKHRVPGGPLDISRSASFKSFVVCSGNLQTRMLAGEVIYPRVPSASHPSTLQNWNYECVPKSPQQQMEDYKLARHRLLREVAFFGMTEYWNESVCLFHKQFGGEVDSKELMNVRPGMRHPPNATQDSIKLLHEHTKYDRKLYAEALVVFKARAQAFGCLEV